MQNHTKDKDKISLDWISRFIVSQPPLSPLSTPHPSPHTSSTSLSQPTPSTLTHLASSSLHPSHHKPSVSMSQPLPSIHPTSSTSLLDTFRYLHPLQGKAYTCWSTLLDCRKTNFGTRIDYILASTCLSSYISQADVWQHVDGSDHCPVFAELDLFLQRQLEHRVPSLCSDYFSGRQIKLSSFMSCSSKERKEGIKKEAREESACSDNGGMKRSLGCVPLPPAKQSKLTTRPSHGVQQTLRSAVSLQGNSEKEILFTSSTSFSVPQGRLNEAWKNVFRGGPKPPQCRGHKQPCVMRKVKKQGPNKDRGFWVCAQPVGSKKDPLARCDHFEWVSKEKGK